MKPISSANNLSGKKSVSPVGFGCTGGKRSGG